MQERGDYMAIIKIKNINDNLDNVINYARNGEKTEHGILVTSVNCTAKNTYNDMMLVKKSFHKETGRLGYHIIQSFEGKEVSPAIANEIGEQLVEELFGDKYQAIICTHTNKFNVHNHIILNSVSFIDGKKYHNSNADIALLKRKSDELCADYDLSVLETPRARKTTQTYEKRIAKYNRNNEEMQKIKADIDEAIQINNTLGDFEKYLEARGYYFFQDKRYYTIESPYFSRHIKLERAFGDNYSRYSIEDRIYDENKYMNNRVTISMKYAGQKFNGPKIDKIRLKFSPFYRYYVHLLYKLGKLPYKNQYELKSPEYYKQKQESLNIMEEFSFIAKHHINSTEDLKIYELWFENELEYKKGVREELYAKLKKVSTPNEKLSIKNEIEFLTYKIKHDTNELKVCRRLMKRHKVVKKDIEKSKAIEKTVISINNKSNEIIK